jgi:hypothetical protein
VPRESQTILSGPYQACHAEQNDQQASWSSAEYAGFEKLAKALIAVPKSEIDKRQTEYERKKANKNAKSHEGHDLHPITFGRYGPASSQRTAFSEEEIDL